MSDAVSPPIALRLFGPFEVRVCGAPLPHLRTRKDEWLLALLALRAGGPVDRAWLAATLWPDSLHPLDNLRKSLKQVRRALGPEIARLSTPTPRSLALDLSGADVDVLTFDGGVASSDEADLQRAIALYGGPLLEGCREEWIAAERQRREEAYLAAIERLANQAMATGEPATAARYLRLAVVVDPLRESAYRALMQALAQSGDDAAALALYRELRQRLYVELHAEPDSETRGLFEQIRSRVRRRNGEGMRARGREGDRARHLTPSTAPSARPLAPASPSSRAAPRHNLPAPPTPLIGREEQVARARELLLREEVRLVTLTGVGGTGKTRLALQIATELLGEASAGSEWAFPDGVFFVSLAPLRDPKLVASTIAQVLEVLSRSASVQLFVQRASDVKLEFALTEENAAAVAAICHRLDGLPLAIELAAARLRVFSVRELLSGLESRLKLLVGGARDLPARQRTLRNTIVWSHDLLDAPEKILFRRLSTFVGGFTLDAAQAVCGDSASETTGPVRCQRSDIADGLASLIENNLLLWEEGHDGEPRFRMLETIREYAAECLEASGEAETHHRRHAEQFLALAEEADNAIEGSELQGWRDRLDAEHDNLRSALAWSEAHGQAEIGLRLGGALSGFWERRGDMEEGRKHLERLLALPAGQARTAARAKALSGAAVLAHSQDDYGMARAFYQESASICWELGDKRGIVWSTGGLGAVASSQGDLAMAQARYEELLAICRKLEDKDGIARSLYELATVLRKQGEHEKALSLLAEARTLGQETGNKGIQATTWMVQGQVLLQLGDYPAARSCYEEGLAIRRAAKDMLMVAWALLEAGHAAWLQGEYVVTRSRAEEALTLSQEVGHKEGILAALESLTVAALAQERQEHAALLMGAVEALREGLGLPGPNWWRRPRERMEEAVRAASLQQMFAAAWAAGRAMTIEEAARYALDAAGHP